MASITAMPNQSMQDIIIQAMGTLEGGMAFCSLNEVSISDIPVVGAIYNVPDGTEASLVAYDADTMADTGVLQYIGQNRIVIGNLGTVYRSPLLDNDGAPLEDNDGENLFDNG
jgi:hypothetical protein